MCVSVCKRQGGHRRGWGQPSFKAVDLTWATRCPLKYSKQRTWSIIEKDHFHIVAWKMDCDHTRRLLKTPANVSMV